MPKVLSLVFRMDSHQWAGPTQVLPYGPSAKQAEKALESLRDYLAGRIPPKPVSQISASLDSWKWKEYRTSTKNLLVAFANSLQVVMPKPFSLKSIVPPNPLLPLKSTESRVQLTDLEKKAMGLEELKLSLYYVFDHKTSEARIDWYSSDFSWWHLTFAADEGTEAGCVERKPSC